MANLIVGPFIYEDEQGDYGVVHHRFRMNKAQAKVALRRGGWRFLKELRAEGVLPRGGCDCGHCAAGWDCCGRMVPSYARVKRVKRGVVVIQHYGRNV